MIWFEEQVHPAVAQRLRVDRMILESRSGFQTIEIFENALFGRVLALDGVVQTTERDEFVYHEMIAHVPIQGHGAARQVLIIGGGDGGALEEVLKHRTVERAVLVEIDPAVIDASRAHLDMIHKGAFSDPRDEIIMADGLTFMQGAGDLYDVIIVDSTDPQGPGRALFSPELYRSAARRLAFGGILVAQCGIPFLDPAPLHASFGGLRRALRDVAIFTAPIPSYCGLMTFAWASDAAAKRHVSIGELIERFAASGIDTRYYAPELHLGAFMLPRFIRDLVERPASPPDLQSA